MNLTSAPPTYATPTAQSPARKLAGARIVEVDAAEALLDHVPAWEDLAADAQEPNVFYEPWMLLPALREYGNGQRLQFLFVYANDLSQPQGPPALCGFFPLARRVGFKGLPISVLGLWRYIHCFYCTPLVRAGCGSLCFTALLDWLAGKPESSALFELPWIAAEGPVYEDLAGCLQARSIPSFAFESFSRAFLKRASTGSAYLAACLSGNRRKKLHKQQRQLGELGEVRFTALQPEDDAAASIETFLSLEATGWKGKQGTALACKEQDRNFFEEIAQEAFRLGRLRMVTMSLDGQPIAQLCDFCAGDGVFSFKIAYDEAFADFSPGILLDLESIRQFHDDGRYAWVDSCNAPGHSVLMSLWRERRAIQTLILPTGAKTGKWVVAAAPILRELRRSLRFIFP